MIFLHDNLIQNLISISYDNIQILILEIFRFLEIIIEDIIHQNFCMKCDSQLYIFIHIIEY